MKKYIAHHMTEHTNVYELHSHVCDSNTRSTPNFHKSLELIVVLDGTCKLLVSDRSYMMSKGDAAFVMPYQIHSFSVEDGGHIRCTTFNDSLVNSMRDIIMSMRPDAAVFTPTKSTYDYFCCQIYELFGRNSGELERIESLTTRLKFKGLLYTLESEFIEQVSFSKINDFESITATVLNYVAENFKEDISLLDIATNTGYNYQYLSRTFNNMMGMNFKQLLNLYRMEYAYRELKRTDRSVTDIAYESGFQSVRTFYRVCLERFGCSPVELRKERGADKHALAIY